MICVVYQKLWTFLSTLFQHSISIHSRTAFNFICSLRLTMSEEQFVDPSISLPVCLILHHIVRRVVWIKLFQQLSWISLSPLIPLLNVIPFVFFS
jgi:hypothetical protein